MFDDWYSIYLEKKERKGIGSCCLAPQEPRHRDGVMPTWVLGSILGNWKGFDTLSGRFSFFLIKELNKLMPTSVLCICKQWTIVYLVYQIIIIKSCV